MKAEKALQEIVDGVEERLGNKPNDFRVRGNWIIAKCKQGLRRELNADDKRAIKHGA